MASIRNGRKQVAALPVRKRRKGRIDVLLVTSRRKGKWIIPKGWPCRGMKDGKSAAKEAREEAGVRGKVRSRPLGSFRRKSRQGKPIKVKVFELKVEEQRKRWPERKERRRKWASPTAAARSVSNPGLRRLLQSFQAT